MLSAFAKHDVPLISESSGFLVCCQYIKLSHPAAHQNALYTSQHLRQKTNIERQGIRASFMPDTILSLSLNYVRNLFCPFVWRLISGKIINRSYTVHLLFVSLIFKVILNKIHSLKTIFLVENYYPLCL